MSNIKNEGEYGLNAADLEKMRSKRIVFIVDECHRSTFGEMLLIIKETFPLAMFFGFTGTPIHEEIRRKKVRQLLYSAMSCTGTVLLTGYATKMYLGLTLIK